MDVVDELFVCFVW